MSKLEELIQKFCPEGVEYKTLQSVVGVNRGSRLTKDQLNDHYEYEVYHGSKNSILGKYHRFNAPKNTTIVVNTGSIGEVKFIDKEFWCSDGSFWIGHSNEIDDKYLYHALSGYEDYFFSKKRVGGVPTIDRSVIENFSIPIPPIEVQREIVHILDNFTELTGELTAELAAELTARLKQYEFYKNQLLEFNKNQGIPFIKINELASYRRGSFPQPYGRSEWYDGEGAMAFVQVADIGDDMRLVTNTKRKISIIAQSKSVFAPKGSIIISLQGSIGRIAITQYDAFIDRTVAIFNKLSDKLVPKYFVYQLQRIFAIKEKTARGSTIKTITKEEFTDFLIPVPPIDKQEYIVSILDRFDQVCNDITSGLPAEIAARQKQYEYYRNKLLTFKELKA